MTTGNILIFLKGLNQMEAKQTVLQAAATPPPVCFADSLFGPYHGTGQGVPSREVLCPGTLPRSMVTRGRAIWTMLIRFHI